MGAYIIRRLVYGVITLLALSIIVFTMIQLSGGSPLDRLRLNPRMQTVIPVLTELFGLDKPAWQQYLLWLKNFVTPVPVINENIEGQQMAVMWRAGITGGVWPWLAGFAAMIATLVAWLGMFKQQILRTGAWVIAGVLWVGTLGLFIVNFNWLDQSQIIPLNRDLDPATFITLYRLGLYNVIPALLFVAATAYTVWAFTARIEASWWRTVRAFSTLGVWVLTVYLSLGKPFFFFPDTGVEFALNWSDSFRGDGPVWDLIFGAAGATFRLGFAALTLALLIGIPLGIYQALRQYSFFDNLGTLGAFIAFSTPIFIVGVGLQLIMALYFERWTGVKLFFVAGMTSTDYATMTFAEQMGDVFRHLTLPALSIALISTAAYSRFQRASMLEVMHSDYLRTAKAKGLPRKRVIMKHALRNALIPIVTLVALDIATIIGGAIITESIFGWPGVGRLYIGAINAVDYPVIMAVVMVIGIGIVIMNILADIMYGVLDPRVRYD
jgi:peptide/nickel transport system permease protein